MKPPLFSVKQTEPSRPGGTLLRGWLIVTVVLSSLVLAACGAPSDSSARLEIFPELAELEPGQSLRFSASVSGELENSVIWSATGGIIEGSGGEIIYTAPTWDGDYEVRVSSSMDPTKFAVASVRVQAQAIEDVSETVDVGGGVVAVQSGAIADFPNSALVVAASVRLRTYNRPVGVDLAEFGAIGYEAVIEIPVASLDLSDGRVFYIGVPSSEIVTGATSAIVTITLDGAEPQRMWASYDPVEENAVQLFAEELKALIAEHGSTPTTIRIAVQPVKYSSGQLASAEVATQSNGVRMQGLHRVTTQGLMSQARTICSSKVQNTPWAGISVPTNRPAVLPPGKVPLVLVHGWQELGITTGRAKESYHPALCAWLDYIEAFRNSEALGDHYELFSYGYDSRISIADNARQFGSVLSNVFGDTSIVLVGHSMGGMISSRVLQRNLGGNIHHLVTLGSPHQGSRFVLCEENDGDRCTKARAAAGASSWVGNLFEQEGTLDLTWQFAGITYTTATCNFEERYCGPTTKESKANSYLEDQNSSLNPTNYRHYTVFYGTKPGTGAMAASGYSIDNIGYLNDGIVPVRSACLSRAAGSVFDNPCNYTVVGNSPRVFFLDHNELKGKDTFSAVEEVLLLVNPEPEAPTEPEPSAPGAFTLDTLTAYCTDTYQSAIRLNWSTSSGAQAYEVHRNGALYSELQTRITIFENTSNVAPGQTYTYFVRARNDAGSTDSNTRSITVPLDVCDETPVSGADLSISGLTVTPSTAPAGSSVTVSFSVTNHGDAPAGASTTRIRVNTNPSDVTTSDWLLAELSTPAIPGGGAQTYTETVTLPASLADGPHYVWVIADVFNAANQVDYGNDRANRFITVGEASSQPACTNPNQVIDIPDANLRSAIAQELGTGSGPILCRDMQELSYLIAYELGIQDIEGLQHATNLTGLELWGNQVSDISVLANLTNLTFLDLGINHVSDISVLENLTNLTGLVLGGNQVSDVSVLANLTNLTYLSLSSNQINDISVLADLINLTDVFLGENQVSDISVLANLTNLTALFFEENQVSDISVLANLTNLTYLSLSSNQINDISVLANLTNLTFLDVRGNQINDISVLANLTNLTALFFGENQVSDISVLENLTNLTSLELRHNQVQDMSVLENLTNLTYLVLWGNEVSDISALANLNNLTVLGLAVNQISDISALANLNNLTELSLEGNQVSDISALTNLTNLTWLNINHNCLDVSVESTAYDMIQIFLNRGMEVHYEYQRDCSLTLNPRTLDRSLGTRLSGSWVPGTAGVLPSARKRD